MLSCWVGALASGCICRTAPAPQEQMEVVHTPPVEDNATGGTVALEPVWAQHNDRDFWVQIPPVHRGVVYLFHGSSSGAEDFLHLAPARNMVQQLLNTGFGVIAYDSQEREEGRWTIDRDSEDIYRLHEIRYQLITTGVLRDDAPEFGIGVSNGGGFVSLIGALEEFRAIAIFLAKGGRQAFERQGVTPAVFFGHAENDPKISLQDIGAHLHLLQSRGVRTELYIQRAQPLTADRFAQIDGISQEESVLLFHAFRATGQVADNGFLIGPYPRILEAAVPEAFAEYGDQIIDELVVTYAGHALFDDGTDQMISFFNASP